VLYADQLGIVFGELYDGEGQRRWSEHALALEPRVDTYRERVVQAELCVRGDTVAARQFVEATEWASDLEERRALGLLAFYRGDAERAEELWREVPRSARDLAVFRHVVGDPAGAATIADSIIPLLQDTLETAVLVGARYRPQQPGEPWSTRGLFEALRGNLEQASGGRGPAWMLCLPKRMPSSTPGGAAISSGPWPWRGNVSRRSRSWRRS